MWPSQRHLVATDPGGVLIDVVQMIEPSAEWLPEHGLG